MPKRYEAIRNALAAKMDYDTAQSKAAAIFNATRKRGEAPVTGSHRKRRKKRH